MLTKEKLANLVKYQSQLKDRLSAPTPEKHIGHPKTYKQFLERELKTVTSQLEAHRLEASGK